MLKVNDKVLYNGELCYIEKIKLNLQGVPTYFLRFVSNNQVVGAVEYWLNDTEFKKVK